MERFKNRRGVTREAETIQCGQDCFGFSHFSGGERVEFEEVIVERELQ